MLKNDFFYLISYSVILFDFDDAKIATQSKLQKHFAKKYSNFHDILDMQGNNLQLATHF